MKNLLSYLRPQHTTHVALSGPYITNERLGGAIGDGNSEVSGSLATLAREMAKQQILAEQQRESGDGAVHKEAEPAVFFRPPSLLARLVETRKLMDGAYRKLSDAAARKIDVSPAGDWLLDNYHIVVEHMSEIRRSMPKNYYAELPKLSSGPWAGYPRVYEMAMYLISGTEGVVDVEVADMFIKEFKRSHLRMGELWAFPIMLRLGLVGNIWRMTQRSAERLADIEAADKWAEDLSQKGPLGSVAILRFMSERPQLTPPFVTRLFARLRAYNPGNSAPMYWLEKYAAEEGVDPEECSRQETVQLSITRTVMANSILSLKRISQGDWLSFFESHSETEHILRTDPSHHYSSMTFETRDSYRHAVEGIALHANLLEEKVAQMAISLAQKALDHDHSDKAAHSESPAVPTMKREWHVGYYLTGEGKKTLQKECGYKAPLSEVFYSLVKNRPHLYFFGSIISLTLAILIWTFGLVSSELSGFVWLLTFFALFLLSNDIAIGIVNQMVTRILPPLLLPRLDFVKHPVPKDCKTVIVVPTLFSSAASVEGALENIEVHYLSNRDPNILYALLSDYTDYSAKVGPQDEAIIDACKKGIKALNTRYGDGIFLLFHRPRLFNPTQGVKGVWMGWERKRGKLVQFNDFLLDDTDKTRSAFELIVGQAELLKGTRYVITLDADTVLPRDAAKKLIGTIAHPLNRAVLDPKQRRVVQGYGIIQPRVTTMLDSACSKFAAIGSGRPGVDPYTTAVSDVYQDLFAEGSFTGKGIYDVHAFTESTEGRFDDNTILSHDLIEGSYARAGLVTNVELFDDYPSHYITYIKRKHRWTRGDWQLLRWGVGFLATLSKQKQERIKLSAISRWKIFDNLRRSVVELDQFLFLVLVWIGFPTDMLTWGTVMGLTFIAFPWIFSFVSAMASPPPSDSETSLRTYYNEVFLDGYNSVIQYVVTLTFLCHNALVQTDAIFRTLYRLVVKRNLLEWLTASQSERTLQRTLKAAWMQMWDVVAVGAFLLIVLLCRTTCTVPFNSWFLFMSSAEPCITPMWSFLFCLPVAILWIFAPSMAHALSAPQQLTQEQDLTAADRKSALRYALLHWRFYDSFCTAESKWMPPDNFQEDPAPVIAMRTSPTNIAMMLQAFITAYDLGFVTLSRMVDLLERSFATLDKMPRFRGHFYNWYDLTNLAVLLPAYVSTVDSGNLAGSLIAIKQACLSLVDEPLWEGKRYVTAIVPALSIVLKLLGMGGTVGGEDPYERDTRKDLCKMINNVLVTLQQDTHQDTWELLKGAAADLQHPLETLKGQESAPVFREVQYWIRWTIELINLILKDELLIHHRSNKVKGSKPQTLSQMAETSAKAASLLARMQQLAQRSDRFAMDMDFTFLFDRQHKLFSIGFNATTNEADRSLYDLLASESRVASYIAIAKNDVPVEHWFRLGRSLVASGALVSWSGTMFEYLMPLILMDSFPNTLLNRTYQVAVQTQMAYTARMHGGSQHVPWGISESAYNFRNRESIYQYRAFGVPDLSLKRGQGKDYVVAPYASMLALHVKPRAAMDNLALLESIGSLGPYGFRDSVDYTRPAAYAELAVVGNYMAHHIGMSLATLDNVLNNRIWIRRFHADTLVASAQLLLHERVPRMVSLVQAAVSDTGFERQSSAKNDEQRITTREYGSPNTPQPRIGNLGMLPYTVMITNSGGGMSNWGDVSINRWANDGTLDATGQWLYINDVTAKRVWSAAHQPVCAPADEYNCTFAVDCVTFHRKDGEIISSTKIAVNTNHLAEVRCLSLTNTGGQPHTIEVTSYGEIVLQSPAADRSHPAFGNLFIQTEWLENISAVLAFRRPRSANASVPYLAHVVALSSNAQLDGPIQYETDRCKFIGRGRSTRMPVALDEGSVLSGTVGAVLDPVFSIRARIIVPAGETVVVSYTTLVSDQKQLVVNRADLYSDVTAARRTFEIAASQMQEELHDLGMTTEDAMLAQLLVGHMLHRHHSFATTQKLARNRLGREGLWAHGISGDWPILLVLVDNEKGLKALRQTLQAHRYWRQKGVTIDIVVVNTQPPTYLQDLHDSILQAITSSASAKLIDKPGGIFLRRKEILPPENFTLLQAIARVHVHCGIGSLKMDSFDLPDEFFQPNPPPYEPTVREEGDTPLQSPQSTPQQPRRAGGSLLAAAEAAVLLSKPLAPWGEELPPLTSFNGYGGMNSVGDYEIRIVNKRLPPAPWANVIANEKGGFLATEIGGGFAWADSSFFYRLTPWQNDPVTDRPGEVVYFRDETDGEIWSATPAPILHNTLYRVIHSPGSTSYEHEHKGIRSHLRMGMALTDPIKIAILTVTNNTGKERHLTMTSFVEWALGQTREHTQHQVNTFFDGKTEALCGRNCFESHFAQLMGFSWCSEPMSAITCDRRFFIGRNGTLERPQGLTTSVLTEITGAGHDPCAVKQVNLTLAPWERKVIVLLLGGAKDTAVLQETLAKRGDGVEGWIKELDDSVRAWNNRLSVIQVSTPEPTFDVMINRWILYQAWACRVWGRSGLYQSSGAFGFRDQLQDVMALAYSSPIETRKHILYSASRQFSEGDVQHWWHPHNGSGIRSKITDDLAWLPFVVAHYVELTGDNSVLDEEVNFLTMRHLNEHEDDIYDQPKVSEEKGTIYEHCLRALWRACTSGAHDLPFIGTGDWNDGMNKVGAEGKGESVWLAWFLYACCDRFVPIAKSRGDSESVRTMERWMEQYKIAADNAWDGAWYRRAYYDDGTPLGSDQCTECKIDSLSQTWSVLSGAGKKERVMQALESLDKHLVNDEARIIYLLTPAFDKADHNPGYIKGYLPGVRENGAQYTHAATWSVLANAAIGRGNRSFELFQMINPLTHALTQESVEVYKTEPYALCGDVYSNPAHTGRGGWSWYTGSASWLYRAGIEGILGIGRNAGKITFNPCLPDNWDECTVRYRVTPHIVYNIIIKNPDHVHSGVVSIVVDGKEVPIDHSGSSTGVTIKLDLPHSLNASAGASPLGISAPVTNVPASPQSKPKQQQKQQQEKKGDDDADEIRSEKKDAAAVPTIDDRHKEAVVVPDTETVTHTVVITLGNKK
eukprot:TRINITY_DN2826_c0_g1_i1.p1 TRINITY_DN2826_c0_g1~~TRINITY_DN2826_c0_g1_i1.p1  ORF type:complete len:3055 (-),score=438.24 TRINITY_DN2826_c0_g1_i1:36-9200(-)